MKITKQQINKIVREEIDRNRQAKNQFEKRIIIVQETIRALVENGDQQSSDQAVLLLKEENDRLDEAKGKGKRNARNKRQQNNKRKKAARRRNKKQQKVGSGDSNAIELGDDDIEVIPDEEKKKSKLASPPLRTTPKQKRHLEKMRERALELSRKMAMHIDGLVNDIEKADKAGDKELVKKLLDRQRNLADARKEYAAEAESYLSKLQGGDRTSPANAPEQEKQVTQAWKAAAKKPEGIKLADELKHWLMGVTSQGGLRADLIGDTKDWLVDLRRASLKTAKLKGPEWRAEGNDPESWIGAIDDAYKVLRQLGRESRRQ